jgi:hypothetical protein
VGSEFASIALYLTATQPVLAENQIWLIFVGICCIPLTCKMTINLFQWFGGLDRLEKIKEADKEE